MERIYFDTTWWKNARVRAMRVYLNGVLPELVPKLRKGDSGVCGYRLDKGREVVTEDWEVKWAGVEGEWTLTDDTDLVDPSEQT